MKKIFNTYDWITNRQLVLENIEMRIRLLLGDKTSGCFVVTLDGPMSGEEAVRKQEGADLSGLPG